MLRQLPKRSNSLNISRQITVRLKQKLPKPAKSLPIMTNTATLIPGTLFIRAARFPLSILLLQALIQALTSDTSQRLTDMSPLSTTLYLLWNIQARITRRLSLQRRTYRRTLRFTPLFRLQPSIPCSRRSTQLLLPISSPRLTDMLQA